MPAVMQQDPMMEKQAMPGKMDQPTQAKPGLASKAGETYQRLALAAVKIVYGKASKGLVETMERSADPAAGIAMAANFVLEHLKQSAAKIPGNAVYAVLPAVVVYLAELGGAAGLFEPSAELVKKATMLLEGDVKGRLGDGQRPNPSQPAAQPEPTEQAPTQMGQGMQPGGLIQSARMGA